MTMMKPDHLEDSELGRAIKEMREMRKNGEVDLSIKWYDVARSLAILIGFVVAVLAIVGALSVMPTLNPTVQTLVGVVIMASFGYWAGLHHLLFALLRGIWAVIRVALNWLGVIILFIGALAVLLWLIKTLWAIV